MTNAMELTVTQKLRLFLARSGQAVAPWSSVEEVLDRLYALLYERREQEGLWHDLAALLDSLQSETRGMLPAPDAEILSQARVDTLVDELRHAVRASVEKPATGAMRRFALGTSKGVLACIALLAAAFSLGCGSSNSRPEKEPDAAAGQPADTATSGSKDTAPMVPDTAPLSPDTAAPSPDTAVLSPDTAAPPADSAAAPDGESSDAGDLPDGGAHEAANAKNDAEAKDALMDLFRDGTPADIAAKLEASADTSPPDRPMVLYKGVTFPADQSG